MHRKCTSPSFPTPYKGWPLALEKRLPNASPRKDQTRLAACPPLRSTWAVGLGFMPPHKTKLNSPGKAWFMQNSLSSTESTLGSLTAIHATAQDKGNSSCIGASHSHQTRKLQPVCFMQAQKTRVNSTCSCAS
eukprot:10776572-Lingulodinium_polyedra.AAC.1